VSQETRQQADTAIKASPKWSIFGWSTWLTLIGTYCGGYLGGFLGAIIVGGLLLFLSRWRKIHFTAALVLSPLLFVVGSVLRTERISQRATVDRSAQMIGKSPAQVKPVGRVAVEESAPASNEAITPVAQQLESVALTPSDEAFREYGAQVAELSLGRNWQLFVTQVTSDAIDRVKAGLARLSDKEEMDQAMSEIARSPGWTNQVVPSTQPELKALEGRLPRSEIHKCSEPGGGVEYRNSPCDIVQAEPSSSPKRPIAPRDYSGPYITVNFASAKIGAVMRILADVSGHDLYIDNSSNVVGSFRYINVRSDRIASEVATKYGLSIDYQGKKMVVTGR
jgi:hypothetical protein